MFPGPLGHSLLGKSMGTLWDMHTINIRDFAKDKHRTVDDTPYGGGSGMVMKPDVVHDAMLNALSMYDQNCKPNIIFMSPRGQTFKQKMVPALMQIGSKNGFIFLCGRYEGIDQRVIDHWISNYGMMEISIGDFVVFGGEMPAMIVTEACLRHLDGVMGNSDSIMDESFSVDFLEYSQYTKPICWNQSSVPSVLLSGNHKEIAEWRRAQSYQITMERRIDLLSDGNRN